MSYNRIKIKVHRIGDPEVQLLEVELSARQLAVLKGLVANPTGLVASEVKIAAKKAGETISPNDIHNILIQLLGKDLVQKREQWVKPKSDPSGLPKNCYVHKAKVDRFATE